MLRLNRRLLLPLLCFLLAVPTVFGQGVTMTRDDQIGLVAPTGSGETGLFTTVTGDTLRRGDFSFGIYFQDFDLFAAPAPELAPPSARGYKDMSYDLYRANISAGYGLTDRWEITASLPWDRLQSHGGDRVGYINGWLYRGQFTDSGIGNLHLATKFGLLPPGGPSKFALSLFTDLPTGDKNSGISTGNGHVGIGAHFTHGIGTLATSYVAV